MASSPSPWMSMIGASLRSKSSCHRRFRLPNDASASRTHSSSGVFPDNDAEDGDRLRETAAKICDTIRRQPRWEGFILSVFPPSTSNILHPTCINLVLCSLSSSNPPLALRYLTWLCSSGSSISVDPEAASSLLNILAQARAWRSALHAIRSFKFSADPSVLSSFVLHLCRDRRLIGREKCLLHDLCDVLEIHSQLSLPAWNSALSASLAADRMDLFQRLYAFMIGSGVAPDATTAGFLIRALCREDKPEEAYQVLRHVSKEKIVPNVFSINRLISAFSESGNFGRVSQILHLMIATGCPPDLVTYQTILHGLCSGGVAGMVDEGLRIFSDLKLKGYKPDVVTYTTMIDGLSKVGRISAALSLWSEMVAKGMRPNEYTYNAVINGYCKSGNLDKARKLYDEMLSKGHKESTVSCNTLIAGLCSNGRTTEAINLFHKMPKKGVERDLITYNTVIQALCKVGKTPEATEFYSRMIAEGINPTVSTYTPLIMALCHDGRVEDATELIGLMETQGLQHPVCMNDFIIFGFCKVGRMEDAMEWLMKMMRSNLKPKNETLNQLVKSFSALGRVDDALKLVNHMYDSGYRLRRPVCFLLLCKLCRGEITTRSAVRLLDNNIFF
ncbi:Pentatricopeptide repeat-containing protein [Apostasia shenzhenica]|uniref:Pentatricopeptide repeat-containing protein n=1 Tax=Apostasia shenzhenica TaxID=1088818 RepID=A0A2I0AER2_9ASPA|nr:Pentatricopeptide repeat-containing protein [Apostasia shenzhenica]